MRSEIGSEFWDIPLKKEQNALFPEEIEWFLSGRAALSYIIQDIQANRRFRTVAMPSWCCHSMIEPFVHHGIEPHFYSVYPDGNGQLTQDLSSVCDCDVLLIMDYFGYSRNIDKPAFDGIVIRDMTHSLFCGVADDADYYFGSLRKWAGFWTGGYAWKRGSAFSVAVPTCTNDHYISMRRQAMEKKQRYITMQCNDKEYLSVFAEAEEFLEAHTGIDSASVRDVNSAKQMDVAYIRQRRRENAELLLKAVKDFALFPQLQQNDCPLFVPILVPDGQRNALRQFLIKNEIYCPIHWPVSELHRENAQTERIYQEELSLICDQRYGVAQIQRVCDAVKDFLG